MNGQCTVTGQEEGQVANSVSLLSVTCGEQAFWTQITVGEAVLCEVLGCRSRVPEGGRKILALNSPLLKVSCSRFTWLWMKAELGFQESHYTGPVYSGFLEPERPRSSLLAG